jgi:preprotein translocase subunit SecD
MVALDKKSEGQNFSAKTCEFRSDSRRLDRTSDRQGVLARSRRSSGRQLKFDWDSTETKPANLTKSKITTNSPAAPNTKDAGTKDASPTATAVVSEPNVQELRVQEPKVQQQGRSSYDAPTSQACILQNSVAKTSRVQPVAASAMRIGQPAKLGVVMMRLLKSYGITDEEIIEALSMPTIS